MMTRIAALLLVAGWCTFAGSAHADPAPPSGPKTTIDTDGTYTVGTDIATGTYTSEGPVGDGSCYWKRINGSEIVDNALSKEPQIVQIEATDTAFRTSHCQPWQRIDCAAGCGPAQASPQDVLRDLKDFIARQQGALGAQGGH
jgi:hypothetical protein